MKTLTTLAVIQTALLIALIYAVLNMPAPPAQATGPSPNPMTQDAPTASVQPARPEPSQAVSAGEMRRIVREEVAALLNSMPAQAQPLEEPGPEPVSAAEYEQRLDLANQQLEYYIREGEISRSEMADLQANIARLDPESRRHMLNLLSRAISSGDLDGHF